MTWSGKTMNEGVLLGKNVEDLVGCRLVLLLNIDRRLLDVHVHSWLSYKIFVKNAMHTQQLYGEKNTRGTLSQLPTEKT